MGPTVSKFFIIIALTTLVKNISNNLRSWMLNATCQQTRTCTHPLRTTPVAFSFNVLCAAVRPEVVPQVLVDREGLVLPIDRFVEELDLRALPGRCSEAGTGYYDPAMLLKVWFFALWI